METTTLLAAILASAIIIGAIYYAISIRYKNLKLMSLLAQALIDKNAVQSKFTSVMSNKTIKDIEEKDGFIKFLAESRESAFSYIEEVQVSLHSIKSDLEPVIDSYSLIAEKTDSMKQVISSYEKINKLLPKNDNL